MFDRAVNQPARGSASSVDSEIASASESKEREDFTRPNNPTAMETGAPPFPKQPNRVYICGSELNVLDIVGRVATGRSSSKAAKQRRRNKKKCVSFVEECEVHEFERNHNPNLVWYTAIERQLIRKRCQFLVERYQFHRDLQWAINVFCNAGDEYLVSDRDIEEAQYIMASARGVRGLEGRVERTSCEVQWILNHQMAVLDMAASPDKSDKELRKTSRSYSRQGAEFALALAEFDAQEAAVAYVC